MPSHGSMSSTHSDDQSGGSGSMNSMIYITAAFMIAGLIGYLIGRIHTQIINVLRRP